MISFCKVGDVEICQNIAGLKQSAPPLVFTSTIWGWASWIFVTLVRPGKWYFQSK